jgi:DNA-binding ferritin-like protein
MIEELIKKIIEEEVKTYFQASIQELIEKEVEEQLTNRNIASKGYVKSTIVEMTSDRINSLQRQINKLFADISNTRKEIEKKVNRAGKAGGRITGKSHEEYIKELDERREIEEKIKFHAMQYKRFQEQLKLFKDF